MKPLPILATFLGALGGSMQAAELPNIILLMGDDHGWEETGYNGHPHVKTPVLDEIAATWSNQSGPATWNGSVS